MSTTNGANGPQADNKSKLNFLVFFAHPDDEAFSCGGVMALNKIRGIHNTLVCATKGEAGEISLPELATSENLGVVREQELIEAGRHMGIDDLHFLGYRDSGMVGTAENQNPAAYINADDSAVIPRLVRFIRSVRPQVVLTFDPTGGYGHPDHLAIHRQTVAAFHAAADPAYDPELGEPWQAQRLFYPAIRREMFMELRDQLISQGIQPPDWGTTADQIVAEQSLDAGVDISSVAPLKWAGFKAHRTQFGPNHPFLQVPEDFALKMLGTEWYELAWPTEKPAKPYTDLFEGIAA